MKPCRAALTSATASGKSTRMASRMAPACCSPVPWSWSCESAAAVNSTAVFRVSVANCSRCASCTDSACCSAKSRSPRRRSSGSPPNGKPPNPPSMGSTLAEVVQVAALHVLDELLDRAGARPDRGREGRCGLAERPFQHDRRGADLVQIGGRGHPWRRADHTFERERGRLRLLDAGRLLDHPHLGELRTQLLQVAAAGE